MPKSFAFVRLHGSLDASGLGSEEATGGSGDVDKLHLLTGASEENRRADDVGDVGEALFIPVAGAATTVDADGFTEGAFTRGDMEALGAVFVEGDYFIDGSMSRGYKA